MTEDIRIDLLDPHPDNPRLLLREDVVKAIVNQLRSAGKYDPMHAIITRPAGGRYQIIAGHHRTEAARRVKLTVIPAWVREMDDEEAFMQLILSNAQGELAPLERGFHALKAVAKGKHGKGMNGYADKVGVTEMTVRRWMAAAEVARGNSTLTSNLLYRADHLFEIHAAPEHCRSVLVERLVKDKWTVKVTAEKVKEVLAVRPPRGYDGVFTKDELQLAVAQGRDVAETTTYGVRAIERARADIRDVQFQVEEHLALFEKWLKTNGGWEYKATAAEAERILDLQRNLRAEEAAKAAKLKRAITLPEWRANTSAEREAALAVVNPKAKLTKQTDDSIEWARWSWNPVTGCDHNCPYCYARDLAELRYPQKFVPSLVPEALSAPMNMTPPKEAETDLGFKNIFTCSMADLFGNWVPDEWILRVLEIAAACPQWNFLMLTKFPQRLAEFNFPDNVWVGTTVDLQARVANAERALKNVKAKTKWVSIEPMIEPIEMDFSLVQWVVIGGATPSDATGGTPATPKWMPPRRWVTDLTARAERAGCEVYHKTNLNLNRQRNYPGFVEPEPAEAPEVFRYLKSGLVEISTKKAS